MNFWGNIRGLFGGAFLRNKPGGMAWINHRVDEGEGGAVLVNRVVRTLRRTHGDFWEIDPPQIYTITRPAFNAISGVRSKPGDRVMSVSIRDECLTPMRGEGISDSEVKELFSPSPAKESEKV